MDKLSDTPEAVAVTQEDYATAERANEMWGRAINGPHVAVLAAALGRQQSLSRMQEEVERLRAEVDRFERPNCRNLSTSDPIVPLPGFQPQHLRGLALLFREWCNSDLWGRPEQAEHAARAVETAYLMLNQGTDDDRG